MQYDLPMWDFIPASIPVNSLWIVFGLFSAVILILSLVLVYHWNKYRVHSPAVDWAQVIYILGVVILLGSAAGSLYLHSLA